MKKFKNIFLLKLPYCTHPDSLSDDDFRTKRPFRPVPSLALATLCAFLEKYKTYNYEIRAIDLNIEAYAKQGVPIDTSVYHNLLVEVIKSNDYDVLALSTMFVYNVKWVDAAVKLSRKFHPEAKIIIGGGYPTLFPERCLAKHDIDDAIIGEGEAAFLHILNKYNNYQDIEFEKKFPFSGYGAKNKQKEIVIKRREQNGYIDLADLPLPAWNYLNLEKYFKKSGDNGLSIEATRGCPFRCSFCSTYLSWGSKVRYKPVENVINEIVEAKKRYNVASLYFVDDNLTFSKEWIVNFLKKIIAMKLPVKLVASNFSVKCLDGEIIDLLVRAGFYNFGIAVESGCPEMQKKINKNLDFDHIKKIVKKIKSCPEVSLHINWMIGFPNETLKQIEKTFDFARELKAHSNQFLVVLPYPQTRLFKEAQQAGLLIFDDEDLDRFDNRQCDYLKSGEWNYNQLQEMIYDANIEMNFLNNPSLIFRAAEGRNSFLRYLEELLLKLPEHIIARLIAGYLYKQKNYYPECERQYKTAIKLFKNKKLRDTFVKYLSWDNPIIKDFNQFYKKTDPRAARARLIENRNSQ